MKKETKILITIVAGLFLLLIAYTIQKQEIRKPMHIHSYLEIEIEGKNIVIPPNIGLLPGKHNAIHTHEEDKYIHVESPVTRTFYLKEFFEVWEKTFNEQCIFQYCKDATHDLKVYVDEKEDNRFGDIVLEDKQHIKIVYSKK